jgi:hypothetical protein
MILQKEPSQNTQVQTIASAPSLKAKLTGDTWSHHQVSRSLSSTQKKFFGSGIPPGTVLAERS